MYELVDHIENLTFFADRMSKQNKSADPTLVISDATLGTTRWMTKEELKMIFYEEIKDKQVSLQLLLQIFNKRKNFNRKEDKTI